MAEETGGLEGYDLMKTRVISSIVGIALLVLIVLSHKVFLGLAVSILALIGLYEFYNAITYAGYRPVKWIGYLSCVPLFLLGLDDFLNIQAAFNSAIFLSLFIFIIVVLLFITVIFNSSRCNPADIAFTVLGIMYIPFFSSFIILIRNLENGIFLIWLIFLSAWATDTFAYFIGIKFGKRKITPVVSPNKTLEGSIAGTTACIIAILIYGLFLIERGHVTYLPLYGYGILGAISSIMAQIGDLAASSVKRYAKIKDYGKIMPGHGGVMDRVDSVLFAAPVVYFYISLIFLPK